MTTEGYKLARGYLIKINKLREFENNKTQVDGFSLVTFANNERNKENDRHKI